MERSEKMAAKCEVCGNEYDKAFSDQGAYTPSFTVALTR